MAVYLLDVSLIVHSRLEGELCCLGEGWLESQAPPSSDPAPVASSPSSSLRCINSEFEAPALAEIKGVYTVLYILTADCQVTRWG